MKLTYRIVLFLFALLAAANTTSKSAACSGSSPNLMAASAERADVQACADAAVDGDRITLPPGTPVYTTGVVVPPGIGIEITGSGAPSNDPLVKGPSASCAATVITLAASAEAFTFKPEHGDAASRLSCMKFVAPASGRAAVFSLLGKCTAGGCPEFRLDNITFDGFATHTAYGYAMTAVGNAFGVLDHNQLNGDDNYLQLLQFHHGSYLGVGSYGDKSWSDPEDYGTSKFIFIENNVFNRSSCCENEAGFGLSDWGGGRVVVRFNEFNITGPFNFAMGFHGTESGGRPRSTRAFEYYGNAWVCAAGPCDQIAGARGGTGLVWGNTNDRNGQSLNSFFTLTTYRAAASLGDWGACDGSSPYDKNDGITYYFGTVLSGGGTGTITVSGSPGWTANQWAQKGAPHSLHDVTQNSGSEITANGSNTVTLLGAGPGRWFPNNGDSIQILRATKCIDQAGGVGAGILYEPNWPATPTAPANQVSSPIYAWLNVVTSGDPNFCASDGGLCSNTLRVIRNRDFYTEGLNQAAQSSASSPFDGTTTIGFGHGTIANRPTSCTPGVGYFATDEGSWNTSGNGFGNGQLYLCVAANAWRLAYTPYAFPHHLAGGGAAPPIPPPTPTPPPPPSPPPVPDPPPPPPPPANTPPVVVIVKPVQDQIIEAKKFTIEARASDDSGGVVYMAIYIEGNLVKSAAPSGHPATMTYTWNTNPYKGRVVRIQAIAKDVDGAVTTVTTVVTVSRQVR